MRSVADTLRPFVRRLVAGELPVGIRFWDGSSLGAAEASAVIVVRSPAALRRMLWAPGELGLARAYVAGDLDIQGDVFAVLSLRDRLASGRGGPDLHLGATGVARLARAAVALRALGLPPPRPAEEARLRGRRHSKKRDASAVRHHYDVPSDFYRIVLGESMTYSCAYFPSPKLSLEQAQDAKHDLVCRKLGLRPGMRLLDVGSGWGGMAIHAAKHYGVTAVGITLSPPQAELAAKRVVEAGMADRVEIRIQDYRDVSDGPYDAVSSIGMFEHVGAALAPRYFGALFGLLAPAGRLLNHAISRPAGSSGIDRRSLIGRYVFPDGELLEVGRTVTAMQRAGFEVRDVESLREHYALTLRRWVANLEGRWEEAQRLSSSARARIWRLYMAGSALSFEAGRVSVHQVLGVKPGPQGFGGMPMTRAAFVLPD
jgi:cyclopropane-fatty-acyl-phospholipid synthase